jgi:hypothetical protein
MFLAAASRACILSSRGGIIKVSVGMMMSLSSFRSIRRSNASIRTGSESHFVASPLQTGVWLLRSAVSAISMIVTILSLHPCLRSEEMWQCRGRVMQAKLADEQAWLKLCGAQSSMGARNGMISWTRSTFLGWCWKLRVFGLYCKLQSRRTGSEPVNQFE